MEPVILPAEPADAAALAALSAEALPPGWPAADFAASCADANRTVLKAMDGAAFGRFIVLQFAADEAEILSIAVAMERRRRGTGSAIMRAAADTCRERAVSSVYLEVAEDNGAALGLYARHGFEVAGKRKDYYQAARPAPATALIMRLDMSRVTAHGDRQEGGVK